LVVYIICFKALKALDSKLKLKSKQNKHCIIPDWIRAHRLNYRHHHQQQQQHWPSSAYHAELAAVVDTAWTDNVSIAQCYDLVCTD